MGFFSWKTADTDESIGNIHSTQPHTKHGSVYLLQPNGESPIEEVAYNGQGVFNGVDAYTWLAIKNAEDLINQEFAAHLNNSDPTLINAIKDSLLGHEVTDQRLKDLDMNQFNYIARTIGIVKIRKEQPALPLKFSYDKYSRYESLPASEECPYQGFEYDLAQTPSDYDPDEEEDYHASEPDDDEDGNSPY